MGVEVVSPGSRKADKLDKMAEYGRSAMYQMPRMAAAIASIACRMP
jgi:hypothetical protein